MQIEIKLYSVLVDFSGRTARSGPVDQIPPEVLAHVSHDTQTSSWILGTL